MSAKGVCRHCDGWGCLQCGILVVPPLGKQEDADLREIDARVAVAVKAEREACAELVLWLDVNSDNDLISANEAAAAIRARGGA